MTAAYGNNANLGVSFQNSFGTALTNSIYWASFLSEEFAVAKEQLISEGMRGVFYEGDHYEGVNSIDGTLEVEANPITIGALLKAAMGGPTSVTSNSMYTHTFKPRVSSDWGEFAANQPVTIVKQLSEGGSAHHYYDMVCSKFGLSISNGEFLKASFGFMGGKYTQSAAVAASYPAGKNWTWDVASITLATSAQGELNELSIEVDEALENKYVLGTAKTPGYTVRSGPRTVSINGTLIFANQNEYQKFLDQSERELIVNLLGTTQIASGYYATMKIQVPLFRYAEFKPTVGGPGLVEVGFSAKGVYSTSSAMALQITLTNTQAAY